MLPTHRPPTHPGEMLLREFIEPMGLTRGEVARGLGITLPRLAELLEGRRSVTAEAALRLECLLGQGVDFWLTLQSQWNLWHARARRLGGEEA